MSTELPFVFDNATTVQVFMAGVRPALEVAHSFSFVLNISELADEGPNATLAIAPGHELRRATKTEIEAIKHVLTNFAAERNWEAWQNGAPVKRDKHKYRPFLPEDKWRYFVIAFEGSNSTMSEIEQALCIAPLGLKIGFTLLHGVVRMGPTLIFSPARLFSLVRSISPMSSRWEPHLEGELPALKVTRADVEEINLLRNQLRTCGEVQLKHFIAQMLDLDASPHESPLLFLGYFAILESLITHQPKPTDTIDSITRQVKQKVMLLNNRWERRIDYRSFGEGKPDTVWKTMYSYRSCLAHGGDPDFKGDLQLLGDPDRALKLLRQTVTGILRQALIEPQLIRDLRNC